MKISAWVTWGIVSLFYAYQYILRVIPSVLISDISDRFKLSSEGFGQFSGVYYLGYSLAHIPVGILLDRFGPRKVVPVCIALTVIGTMPLLFSDFWVYPIVGRVLVGIGSSAAILSVFKVIQMTFDEKKFSRILSFSVTLGLFGAMYGGKPIHTIKTEFGYDVTLMGVSMLGLVLALAAYVWIPDTQEQSKVGQRRVFSILSNWRILSLCALAGLMVGPLEGFADAWGAQFFKQVYHLNGDTAASLPSLIFLGMCIGGPFLCSFADWTGRHLIVVMGCAMAMAVAFLLLLTTRGDPTVLSVLLFGIGVCCAYQMLMIYRVSVLAGKEFSGLATAVSNMIIMIFGYLYHSVIGKTVGFFGGLESAEALSAGVSVVPVGLGLSVLGLLVWMSSLSKLQAFANLYFNIRDKILGNRHRV